MGTSAATAVSSKTVRSHRKYTSSVAENARKNRPKMENATTQTSNSTQLKKSNSNPKSKRKTPRFNLLHSRKCSMTIAKV